MTSTTIPTKDGYIHIDHRRTPIPDHRPVARVARNAQGGYSLLIPDAGRVVGNYPTETDADRALDRSGFRRDGASVPRGAPADPIIDGLTDDDRHDFLRTLDDNLHRRSFTTLQRESIDRMIRRYAHLINWSTTHHTVS